MKPWDDTNILAKKCITYCSPALISREGEVIHNPQQWESQKAVNTKFTDSFGAPTLGGQLTCTYPLPSEHCCSHKAGKLGGKLSEELPRVMSAPDRRTLRLIHT